MRRGSHPSGRAQATDANLKMSTLASSSLPESVSTGQLSSAVSAMVGDLPPPPTLELADHMERLLEALSGPLRLAVAGRVKAGKSTVVNALLGQKVAATDAGECTRLVTRFHFGFPEKAQLTFADGRPVVELPLLGGALGASLPEVGQDAEPVIDVWLSNELLRSITVIDTPGFGSANEDIGAVTADFFLGGAETGIAVDADAVVFVLSGHLVDSERQALGASSRGSCLISAWRCRPSGCSPRWIPSPITSTSKPMPRRDVRSHARDLREFVSDVVPVVGILAQTAGAGLLTETDSEAIATLAGVDEQALKGWLLSVDRFHERATCLAEAQRVRLCDELLGLYGIDLSVQAYREGAHGAAALTDALASASFINPLRRRLLGELRANADALRASRALRLLSELSYRSTDDPAEAAYLSLIRDRVEQLRLSPVAHALDEREVRHAIATGLIILPPDLRDEALRVTSPEVLSVRLGAEDSPDIARLIELAREGAARWRAFGFSSGTLEAERVATVIGRSYELAHLSLTNARDETSNVR